MARTAVKKAPAKKAAAKKSPVKKTTARKATIKSAVAGNPNDSDVSSSPTSVDVNPCLLVCVAVMIGSLNSTARPLSSSAILLTIV